VSAVGEKEDCFFSVEVLNSMDTSATRLSLAGNKNSGTAHAVAGIMPLPLLSIYFFLCNQLLILLLLLMLFITCI
jgi:hypothetical protein